MLLVMLHTRLFCVLGLIDTLWVCKLGFTHVLIRLVILPPILSCSAFIELLEEETLLYSVAYLSLKSSAMAASPRVLSIIGTVWHVLWKSNGCPRDGYFAEQRRITRARYHRVELLGTLSEMQTKYEWKKWLMLFCLIAQLIFGGRSRK